MRTFRFVNGPAHGMELPFDKQYTSVVLPYWGGPDDGKHYYALDHNTGLAFFERSEEWACYCDDCRKKQGEI